MTDDKTQVIDAIETMTRAFKQKDVAGVLSSYEQGAIVMFEPGEQTSGITTIKQMFKGIFQTNPNFIYPQGHEVYLANDIALHIAPWVMQGIAPDGSAIQQRGLSTSVLRKQADGRWLLVLDNPHGQRLLEQ